MEIILEGEENPIRKAITFQEALEYAYSLRFNWRLPTKEELVFAHQNKIEGFPFTFLWTKDEKEHTIDLAWYYVFGGNEKGIINKGMNFRVRLCKEIK